MRRFERRRGGGLTKTNKGPMPLWAWAGRGSNLMGLAISQCQLPSQSPSGVRTANTTAALEDRMGVGILELGSATPDWSVQPAPRRRDVLPSLDSEVQG